MARIPIQMSSSVKARGPLPGARLVRQPSGAHMETDLPRASSDGPKANLFPVAYSLKSLQLCTPVEGDFGTLSGSSVSSLRLSSLCAWM